MINCTNLIEASFWSDESIYQSRDDFGKENSMDATPLDEVIPSAYKMSI